MFRVWHCNCNTKLLQIRHESFEFATAVAAPTCKIFCMQALSLALQLQRQIVIDILQPTFEFRSAIAAPTC
jgi:hypothetical protein